MTPVNAGSRDVRAGGAGDRRGIGGNMAKWPPLRCAGTGGLIRRRIILLEGGGRILQVSPNPVKKAAR